MNDNESTDARGQDIPDPTQLSAGEFAKSKTTRTRILQAAVECLADIGYNATTTTAVAERAKLSRTAMLYHFPSRRVLIDAIVQYVTRRRVEMQQEHHVNLPDENAYRSRSVESVWGQIQTREFFAFCELSMAARTDKELAKVFEPSLEAFDRARREMALKLALPDSRHSASFDLRRDVTRFLLEGIAQQNGITFDKDQRMAQIKTFLAMLWSEEAEDLLLEAVRRAGQEEAP